VDALDPNVVSTAVVMSSVLAATGILFVASTYLPFVRRWAPIHGLIGHLALYCALAPAVAGEGAFSTDVSPAGGIEDAALIAFGAMLLVHGIEALLMDVRGVPSIEAAIAKNEKWEPLRTVPGFVTALVVTPFTLLACWQFTWFADQPARLGIPLTLLGIGFVTASLIAARPVIGWTCLVLGYAAGVAAVAVPIPDADVAVMALALTVGVATAGLASVRLGSPAASALAWVSGYAAIAAWAFQADLAEVHLFRPVLVTALAVTSIMVILHLVPAAHALRPWVATAVMVGVATTAVGMVFAVNDGDWSWAWGLGAGAATGAVAVAYRIRLLTPLVWLYLLIAYVDMLETRIENDIVWLLPFVALVVLVAALLPGRRSRNLTDPSVLSLGVGLLVMTAASIVAVVQTSAPTLAWSAMLLAVVALIRAEDLWLHLAVAVGIGSGAMAGELWLPVSLACAAVVETALAEWRRDTPAGLVLPWFATTLWAASAVATVTWLEVDPQWVVLLSLTAGAGLSAGAVAVWLLGSAGTIHRRWVDPIGAVGQLALASAAVEAYRVFGIDAAALTWATVAWIEAVLVGYPATVRRARIGVWVSTALVGVGGALALRGMRLDWLEAVWSTAFIGGALLTVWLVSVIATEEERITMWRAPTAVLAQVAFVASGTAAWLGLPMADAQLTSWVLLLLDAAAIGLVATLQTATWMAATAGVMTLAAVQLVMWWRTVGTAVAWMWFGVVIVVALAATGVTRLRSDPHANAWVIPLHLMVVVASVAAIGTGSQLLAPRDAMLLAAAVAASIGGHLIANREWIATSDLPGDVLGSATFVVSAGFVAASLGPDDWWAMPTLLAIALGGAVAAGVAGVTAGLARLSWIVVGTGFSAIAAVGTFVLFPPVSAQFGWMLIVNGAGFAAYALTARQPLVLHVAVVTWLAGVLVLIEYQWTLELLATVTAVCAVLLVMVEVERTRRRRLDEESPEWLHVVEWALMLPPLVLAGREMATTSLWYGLLLGLEGAVLLAWGIATQVRRRAVLGMSAITAAILMAVMVPLVQGMGQSMSGGWWLVIGGLAAALFIATGSVLEKYRTRIGERLAHTAEILERWE
ncbi:MAG: hypothetical protein R6W79_09845, partial [Acidimicrobiia bacterium]